ncbi:hypothetical protein HY224_00750 [Candidatus Uhrbacteria bacterium]|nr:hypothetical protein [Candidatus Uhrbacteria bacterium]
MKIFIVLAIIASVFGVAALIDHGHYILSFSGLGLLLLCYIILEGGSAH